MPAAPLRVTSARGVLSFATPEPRDPAKDELFIKAVKNAYPTVIARQLLPPDAPPNIAHVSLASSSSQLLLSAVQTELLVQFYGEFDKDVELALGYLDTKMKATLVALNQADLSPVWAGVVLTLHLPLAGQDSAKVSSTLAKSQLRHPPGTDLQEIAVRLAGRIENTYFASFEASSYEQRGVDRPIMPGVPFNINPWEGEIRESGIQIVIDVNNRLRSVTSRGYSPTEESDLAAIRKLLNVAVRDLAPTYALRGSLDFKRLGTAI